MRFDFGSFSIGFVTAAVIAIVLYRLRAMLGRARQSVSTQIGATGQNFTSSAETRYIGEMVKLANSYHIVGDKADLLDLYIEPRFLAGEVPLNLDDDTELNVDPFRVVPRLQDLPASYSAYNINTLTVHDLRSGDRHLALLGVPGIGKSTTLAILALHAVGRIELQNMDTLAAQVIATEDEGLSDSDRKARQKIRAQQQAQALEQHRLAREREAEKRKSLNLPVREPLDFQKLLPILVHLRDIDLSLPAEPKNAAANTKQTVTLDPAEPLVRAAMRRLGTVAANVAPRLLYTQLNAGRCLVLLDGFDEIGLAQWPEKLTWLTQFMAAYGQNVVITTGPVAGYDALVNVGLTPLFVRPWADDDAEKAIDRFATAWPVIAGSRRKPAADPDPKLVKRVQIGNRGRMALDVTLKAWAAFAGGEQESGRRGAYDVYMRSVLPDAEKQRALLGTLAATVLDNGGGLLSRDQIKAALTDALGSPDGKAPANLNETVDKLIGTASKTGLLVDAPGGAYLFRHPLFVGFLASETLINASPERLDTVAANPAWDMAMPFAAVDVPLDAAVQQRLSAPPDLLYNNLFSLANWLADAPLSAGWKREVLKRFTAAMIAPSQYPMTRERAMAALVTTRDPGVLFVLRQSLRSGDANVRRLSCVGLGALGDAEAVKDLEPMLGDSDGDVQLAAGLALGAIGSEAALSRLVNGLLNGDENLRRAVAESLAALPEGGYDLLRDYASSDNGYVRRAVVLGLRRVRTPWSLALINKALLEDKEWYVRSAAQAAFFSAEQSDGIGPQLHPDADQIGWLVTWAANRGDSVPVGVGGREMLIRALQEADPLHRAAAALTIAYLGYVPGLKPLYAALRDKDDIVRGSVYEALAIFQMRLGQPLPAV